MNLVNDNIRTIFDELTASEIINYCSTSNYNNNLCKTDEFHKYFSKRFFPNMDNILSKISKDGILNLAKLIFDNNPTNTLLTNLASDIIKDSIIIYYIGNYPLLLKLDNKSTLELFSKLYPTPYTFDKFKDNGDLEVISEISDILNRAFSLNYSTMDIMNIMDTIQRKNIIYNDIYLMCIIYGRKDVYNAFQSKYKVNKDLIEYSVDLIPELTMMGTLGRENAVYSEYLTFNDDVINIPIKFDEYLLEDSYYPKLLFNKYKDRFLQDPNFANSYYGKDISTDHIPYLLNDNVDLDKIKGWDKDEFNGFLLRLLNPEVINLFYNIEDDGDNEEIALELIRMKPKSAWELLSIVTKNKGKDSIDRLYSNLLTEAAEVGYVPISVYTCLLYRFTLPSSTMDTLTEYMEYLHSDN
ncbi:Hypothetical protein ORPV_254 [Orpheovirus IHUMI-LCC2]|uniref:Uncharacterized protein n=1 Tax=Orpheovirus IHUMI-LCC2 TaxID=2023057 RepID=A0A2I2L3P8_9VIRU|nr:Hypothetical protein ORPV_254 [Orpheovirus IHUMI-LCC2]SNW62158.1 Hypothetical protein ORPV_254 [Orpheovirus IHUMI-LCC2]